MTHSFDLLLFDGFTFSLFPQATHVGWQEMVLTNRAFTGEVRLRPVAVSAVVTRSRGAGVERRLTVETRESCNTNTNPPVSGVPFLNGAALV